MTAGAAMLVAVAYLCGSVPTGVWLGRWAGVDVRGSGSGNIGATNVARTAGAGLGLLTLTGDVLKGALPALLARWWLAPEPAAVVGLAAFFGHIFSVFLRFSGGKGVATAFGVFAVLTPAATGIGLLIFAVTALATRIASLASLAAAAALAAAAFLLGYASALAIAALVTALVVFARHRENISRLLRGTEPKFRLHRR